MIKGLACIALLFAVFVAAHAGRFGGQGGRRPDGHGSDGPGAHGSEGNGGQWLSKLCANQSTANSFENQTQQLINILQTNGSFTQFLADRAQGVAYILSSDNTALLSSNCTAYFIGLGSAINADQTALQAKLQYYQIADNAFKDIIRSLIGRGGGHGHSGED